MNNISGFLKRSALIYGIMALIAAVHIFRLGSYLQGGLYNLYYSYFSDFIIPFGCYFLLKMPELYLLYFFPEQKLPIIERWETRAALAFLIPSIAETCQYFGIPILGSTFDPLDYCMYGAGALAAAVVDVQVFARAINFWTRKQQRKG